MWSLCNEGGCMEGEPAGAVVGASFKSIIKTLDPFRPVVAAMNADWGEDLSFVLDIRIFLIDITILWSFNDAQGINYNYQEYEIYHNTFDYQPIFGSETASCLG